MSDKPSYPEIPRGLLPLTLACNAVSIMCVWGAVMTHPGDGWGWFLVVAFCTAALPKAKCSKCNEESE